MKYENVRLTEAVRRIRMIFVVGVIAACVLYGGKIPAFAEDTQEQYDSSQSSYGQLLEQEGDTSGILHWQRQIQRNMRVPLSALWRNFHRDSM